MFKKELSTPPVIQPHTNSNFTVETASSPVCAKQEVPILSQEDIILFGGIEQAAKLMTKEGLMQSLGLK